MEFLDTAIRKKKAETKYREGLEYHKKEQFNEAEASYHEAIRIDPGFYKAYVNIGTVTLQNLKNPGDRDALSKAEQFFNKALELKPDNAISLFNLGTMYYMRYGKEEKAFDYFAQAINADPLFMQQVKLYLGWASYTSREDFKKVVDRSIYSPDRKKITNSLAGLQSKPNPPADPYRMIRIEDPVKTIGILLIMIGIFYILITPVCDRIAFNNTLIATILLFLAVLAGIVGIFMAKTRADKVFNSLLVIFFLIFYYRVILGCYHP